MPACVGAQHPASLPNARKHMGGHSGEHVRDQSIYSIVYNVRQPTNRCIAAFPAMQQLKSSVVTIFGAGEELVQGGVELACDLRVDIRCRPHARANAGRWRRVPEASPDRPARHRPAHRRDALRVPPAPC
jgi:hypothetical protein